MELGRKGEILNAVEVLIKERGAKGVTIDDLCNSISISKKTFYKYFSSKHEVMIAFLKFSFQSFEELIEKETEEIENPIHKQKKIYELLVDGILSYNPVLVNDLKSYYKESHEARMEFSQKLTLYISKMIRSGQREKVFKAEVDPELVARLIIRETESLWSRVYNKSKEILRKEQLELFDIILSGITVNGQ